ncbi:hypothetical protein [Sphingomonas sp. 32-62-10]
MMVKFQGKERIMSRQKPLASKSIMYRLTGVAPPGPIPERPVWQHWEALHRLFPTWRFLGSILWTWSRPHSGFDALRQMRMNRSVVRGMVLLDQLDTQMLDDLIALARTNAERQGYLARTILIAYVSIPFSVGALVAQVAPLATQQVLLSYASAWGGGLAGAGVAVVARLILDAQARQFVAFLEMARIERGEPA